MTLWKKEEGDLIYSDTKKYIMVTKTSVSWFINVVLVRNQSYDREL